MNHSATRTYFKDVNWTEQAQDGLKFFSIMKTDVHDSIYEYKSRKFLNRQCVQTAPRNPRATEPVNATRYWSQYYNCSWPMFEKEMESVFRKQLK
jgi:hypothetical protein